MNKVLPILFNTEMVQAILREVAPKTATRRTIKGYIPKDAIWGYTAFTPKGYISCRGTFKDGYGEKFFKLPYQKDDTLYVRETWCNANKAGVEADYYYLADTCICEDYDKTEWKWRPSIHMPKKAARIWLKVVADVRVERLHDMTLDDFLSEGVVIRPEAFNDPENAYMQARSEFARIWDSTIKKSQTDLNPWVWVTEFERCEKPEEIDMW